MTDFGTDEAGEFEGGVADGFAGSELREAASSWIDRDVAAVEAEQAENADDAEEEREEVAVVYEESEVAETDGYDR